MKKAENYYNELAKGYDELYGPEQLSKWDAALKLIKFSRADNVLDVGCGTGIITSKIAEVAHSVVGIDISKGMIEVAHKRYNIIYVIGDASKLPFPDDSFDKVVSFTMVQDVKDWDPVLKEMKRVSRGYLLVTFQKRGKSLESMKKKISEHFKIIKAVEEEKDFLFLLA